jgi:phosphate uptake regulator
MLPKNMKRRVIKQGHNTLTLTLPSKWAKKFDIKPGDEIELEEKESSLLVNGKKSRALKTTILDLKGVPIIYLWRSIISAYRAGYDEMTVFFQNPKEARNIYTGFGYDNLYLLVSQGTVDLSPIEAIQALVNRLIGIEIIDQKESYCVIKEMGETTYKEFDNALRRIFLLLQTMADECYECYKKNHKEPLRSIHMIDTNLDRFEDFCLRVLNKIGYKDYRKTSVMHSLIFTLELVGDEFKKLALHFLDSKDKSRPLMTREFEIQKNQLRRIYELFYKYSKEKVQEIYEKDKEGDQYLNENYSKFSDEEKEIIHHFKKIGIYVLSLTELRMDLEI